MVSVGLKQAVELSVIKLLKTEALFNLCLLKPGSDVSTEPLRCQPHVRQPDPLPVSQPHGSTATFLPRHAVYLNSWKRARTEICENENSIGLEHDPCQKHICQPERSNDHVTRDDRKPETFWRNHPPQHDACKIDYDAEYSNPKLWAKNFGVLLHGGAVTTNDPAQPGALRSKPPLGLSRSTFDILLRVFQESMFKLRVAVRPKMVTETSAKSKQRITRIARIKIPCREIRGIRGQNPLKFLAQVERESADQRKGEL